MSDLTQHLNSMETMLDDLERRADKCNSTEHAEYLKSGIRTIKNELFQAMRKDLDTWPRKRHCLICDREMRNRIDEDPDYCRECKAEGH